MNHTNQIYQIVYCISNHVNWGTFTNYIEEKYVMVTVEFGTHNQKSKGDTTNISKVTKNDIDGKTFIAQYAHFDILKILNKIHGIFNIILCNELTISGFIKFTFHYRGFNIQCNSIKKLQCMSMSSYFIPIDT